MATPGNPDQRLIRCPVCLKRLTLSVNTAPDETVVCKSCSRFFKVSNALPAKDPLNSLSTTEAAVAVAQTSEFSIVFAMLALISAFAIGIVGRSFSGPEFITYYAAAFVVALIATTAIRWNGNDSMIVSVYGFLLHEGIAVTRLFTSQSPEPRKYGFLIGLMLVGGIAFFVRAQTSGTGSGGSNGWFSSCSSSGSSCSGGSSCGGGSCGGGCGGGGCGGGGCGG